MFNMTPEEWDIVVKTHLCGAFSCTKPASALMWQQKSGRIVDVSSIGGLGIWNAAIDVNYASAKEGLIGFTRAVAIALGRGGITCNAIRPSGATRIVRSPEGERALRQEMLSVGMETLERASMALADPEDVAPFVVWLCTDAAAGINGYDFRVTGGHIGLYSQPTEIKCIDKEGRWTLDEMDRLAPVSLAAGLKNRALP